MFSNWLDLDTGRQMSLSFPDDEAAKLALFRTNGLDVMGIVTKEEIGVACREMVVRHVEGSRVGIGPPRRRSFRRQRCASRL